MTGSSSARDLSWIHEYAIIRMYRSFEDFMEVVLVGCLNQDSKTLSDRTGIQFPKHLSVPVWRYLVTCGNYFDFRGRGGLIRQLTVYLGKEHDVVGIVKNPAYRDSLDRLCALRNFAAHGSDQSKTAAKTATRTNMRSAGAWLKRQGRLAGIATDLKTLANEIDAWARF